MSLKKSPHFTSVTEGAILSGAKLPKFFEYPAIEGENNDETYFRDGDMGLEEAITKMKTVAMAANDGDLPCAYDSGRMGLEDMVLEASLDLAERYEERLGDFASLDEAIEVIDDVINNGEIVANPNAKNNIDIDKGNYRVSIAQDENGRWVLTAFDKDTPAKEKKKRKDAAAIGTPGQPDEGAGAVAPNLSEGKGSKKVGEGQGLSNRRSRRRR